MSPERSEATRKSSFDSGPRYTPRELAQRLGLNYPTDEQAEVIAAPVAPLLVVAGAGSGKTETMAARVLWLVANDHVRPDQILGLTFTRKAAGELAHRVRMRLGQLRRRMDEPRTERLDGEPTIATYHSFAARIVSEHGLRAGYEPSNRLLSEAACWQLADEVVRTYNGDMSLVEKAASTVTAAVRALAAEMAEHLVDPDDLATWTGRFSAELSGLPGTVSAPVRELLANQRARLQLLPLVRRYAERKAQHEAMDFGDQLARAAMVARDHPEVGALERQRFAAVLLDEYQDTSHAQVTLLRSLFGGGHPVTSVGDPCQSIYGWRGASAGTLDRFPGDFPRTDGEPAGHQALSRSFRNREQILRIANSISAPLRDDGARVVELTGDGRPGHVHCALLPTFEDEAQWIANRIQRIWEYAGEPKTTAVLVRVRSQIAPIEAALREREIPVEVVGLGGLLDTPEVRDVVSTLRVLADPMEGAALLRLLTGPRWRIGPRDLVALHRRSRVVAKERRHPDALITDRLDDATLMEALDDLGPAEDYSPAGFERLVAYQKELNDLRRHLDQPLPDLIGQIERTMGLSVEVSLREGDGALARAHLDALGDVAASFGAESDGATLPAFLAYLAAAEDEERGLSPGEVEVVEGAVQILTAHAAKGLEWDIVAVAGLTQGVWPGSSKRSDNYLVGLGVLPFPLRGDRSGLPALRRATDQKDLAKAVREFDDDWKTHDEREERRLAYVAVTRPREWLLATGYWWGPTVKRPRGPSVYLEEIAEACRAGQGMVAVWTPPPAEDAVNPTAIEAESAIWPHDPLGARRPMIAAAAALVQSYIDGPLPDQLEADTQAERWRFEADLLLRERAEQARLATAAEVPLPAHLSVSQLVALRKSPGELARSLRRPLPRRPDPIARRGTAFHAWLEQRYGADRLLDLGELPGAADEEGAEDTQLAALQESFLASEWADRTPVEVEVPFATEIGGVVIRGRMDAVFRDPDGRYDVVDWKTGRRPSGVDATAAAVQLAAYRLAWAALTGTPVEQVRAAFHYVADNVTVRPADLLDSAGLQGLIGSLPVAASTEV
ncbi:DNA helicase-2/ATP-dependent DNA helicase PcrA [Allocatelliglobosispora scoriae]|uniref:DNA 3'-5' helicase n=1 Tax=Allocatelliglobosispora scoriae TaxID=643052 RepID=A0A841BYE2_9ACTN|nr:UvrD-helicase domain-containing protein [Allocatelliglobosispora scoriae]MBB5871691.1 DNA helicase-2/ATP-dependent DNA helicase PcrA [Allocatelliglobosispora scoriae]